MEKDGKRKVSFSGQSSGSNVRPCFSQPNQFFKPLQKNRPPMPVHVPRSQFLTQRPNFQAQRPSFQMQRPQHQPPQPNGQQPSRQNMQQGPRSNAPTTHGAPTQGNRTGGACFKCGLTGQFCVAMSHPVYHSWSRKPSEVTRVAEFHAWQGQSYDQRGSSASPGHNTGYVSCQFAPYNYFI
jgi:hypothetical protein